MTIGNTLLTLGLLFIMAGVMRSFQEKKDAQAELYKLVTKHADQIIEMSREKNR